MGKYVLQSSLLLHRICDRQDIDLRREEIDAFQESRPSRKSVRI